MAIASHCHCHGTSSLSKSMTRPCSLYPKTKTSIQYLFSLIFVFLNVFTLVVAQTSAPLSAAYSAYTTLDEKTFYIHGGRTSANGSDLNQFFSLDLTQSWNASNPPWKALSTGSGSVSSPSDYQHSMTISKDKQNLIIRGHDSGLSIYNIPTNSWVSSTSLPPNSTLGLDGIRVITDPNTGILYSPTGAVNATMMMQYDPATLSATPLPMPAQLISLKSHVTYYGLVWSTFRNSMLMYGGATYNTVDVPDLGDPYFYEYFPTNSSWNLIPQLGDYPGDMNSHCMVPAYNGTMIVVFGGGDITSKPNGNIYTIDAKTLTWKKVNTVETTPVNEFRTDAACTVAGDYFVAWGGDRDNQNNNFTFGFGVPLIYNLRTNEWTTSFISVSDSTTTSLPGYPSTTPTDSSTGGTKSSLAPIVGGVVAGVVVVAAIIFFVYKRQRSRRASESENRQHSPNHSKASLSYPPPKYSQEYELDNTQPTPANTQGRRARAPEEIQPSRIHAPGDSVYSARLSSEDNSTVVGSPLTKFQMAHRSESLHTPTEITPGSPHSPVVSWTQQYTPSIRSPQGFGSQDPNSTMIVDQIEQIRAQHEEQYRQQQEYLEQLRLQQQAQLENLKLQLTMPVPDTNTN